MQRYTCESSYKTEVDALVATEDNNLRNRGKDLNLGRKHGGRGCCDMGVTVDKMFFSTKKTWDLNLAGTPHRHSCLWSVQDEASHQARASIGSRRDIHWPWAPLS